LHSGSRASYHPASAETEVPLCSTHGGRLLVSTKTTEQNKCQRLRDAVMRHPFGLFFDHLGSHDGEFRSQIDMVFSGFGWRIETQFHRKDDFFRNGQARDNDELDILKRIESLDR
jgi:hypothetical protein